MELKDWLKQAAEYLVSQWGIKVEAAPKFAMLYVYLWSYGLNPRITSGHRSQAKQDAMRAAWDRGDRAGLKYRPAEKSRHTSGVAMDIVTSNPKQAADIARALGMKTGIDYGDDVHFEA